MKEADNKKAETTQNEICDLGGITPLLEPWETVNGQRFPRFSPEAARLSLALSRAAYSMDMDAWREAGWADLTFQIDNKLYTGGIVNETGGFLHEAMSDWIEYLARSKAKRINPISQIRGTLRQRESADTCKAVVMIHKAVGGRYAVAIGFMGTGKRVYDWISNFRMENDDGLHQGFHQLTDEFIGKCDEIVFPSTAAELGLEKLTLNDIFKECGKTNSRFFLWMSGHSQGGAIMQVLAYHLVMSGVRRTNMIGYGFASPSVVYGSLKCDLMSFPLYHLINSDDLTPRVGAVSHIGRCRVLIADKEMAGRCYRNIIDDEAFADVMRMVRTVRCTSDAAMWTVGFLQAVRDLPAEDSEIVFKGLFKYFMNDRLYDMLSDRLGELMDFLIRKTEAKCKAILGTDSLPEASLMRYDQMCAELFRKYGAMEFIRTLLLALVRPHKIRTANEDEGDPPYAYMVTERFSDLRDVVFHGGTPHMWTELPNPTGMRSAAQKPHTGRRFAGLSGNRARRQRQTSAKTAVK